MPSEYFLWYKSINLQSENWNILSFIIQLSIELNFETSTTKKKNNTEEYIIAISFTEMN